MVIVSNRHEKISKCISDDHLLGGKNYYSDETYECPVCCEWYDNKLDRDICSKHCSLAVDAYMRDRHISKEQAIKQYRLEGL